MSTKFTSSSKFHILIFIFTFFSSVSHACLVMENDSKDNDALPAMFYFFNQAEKLDIPVLYAISENVDHPATNIITAGAQYLGLKDAMPAYMLQGQSPGNFNQQYRRAFNALHPARRRFRDSGQAIKDFLDQTQGPCGYLTPGGASAMASYIHQFPAHADIHIRRFMFAINIDLRDYAALGENPWVNPGHDPSLLANGGLQFGGHHFTALYMKNRGVAIGNAGDTIAQSGQNPFGFSVNPFLAPEPEYFYPNQILYNAYLFSTSGAGPLGGPWHIFDNASPFLALHLWNRTGEIPNQVFAELSPGNIRPIYEIVWGTRDPLTGLFTEDPPGTNPHGPDFYARLLPDATGSIEDVRSHLYSVMKERPKDDPVIQNQTLAHFDNPNQYMLYQWNSNDPAPTSVISPSIGNPQNRIAQITSNVFYSSGYPVKRDFNIAFRARQSQATTIHFKTNYDRVGEAWGTPPDFEIKLQLNSANQLKVFVNDVYQFQMAGYDPSQFHDYFLESHNGTTSLLIDGQLVGQTQINFKPEHFVALYFNNWGSGSIDMDYYIIQNRDQPVSIQPGLGDEFCVSIVNAGNGLAEIIAQIQNGEHYYVANGNTHHPLAWNNILGYFMSVQTSSGDNYGRIIAWSNNAYAYCMRNEADLFHLGSDIDIYWNGQVADRLDIR